MAGKLPHPVRRTDPDRFCACPSGRTAARTFGISASSAGTASESGTTAARRGDGETREPDQTAAALTTAAASLPSCASATCASAPRRRRGGPYRRRADLPDLPAVTVAVLEDRAQGLVAGLHRRRSQFRVVSTLPPSSRGSPAATGMCWTTWPRGAGLPARAAMDIPAPGVEPDQPIDVSSGGEPCRARGSCCEV
jgi:hypothetical protein